MVLPAATKQEQRAHDCADEHYHAAGEKRPPRQPQRTGGRSPRGPGRPCPCRRSGRRQGFRTHLKIRRGDAVGLQLSVGAYGNAPYSQGAWLERWAPPLGAERRPSDKGAAHDYELLYNASIERDRDGDGFGDVTEDRCPRDAHRHEGC